MNAVQERIAALKGIRTPLTTRDDFDAFWSSELANVRNRKLFGARTETTTLMSSVKSYHVTYYGADETPLYGWFLVPHLQGESNEGLPCIVQFHGYTGGKGFPEEYADWLMMGLAVFAVDVRGQGGETGNLMQQSFGMTMGWFSQGVLERDHSYFKAIILDAVRAIDWAADQPEINPERIAVVGASQGGGLTLLSTALHDKVSAAVAHIPNMCRMDWGIMHSTGSVAEAGGLASIFPDKLDDILETLSYFDAVNFANRITVPIMVSANLKDTVCWPETVLAAYNRIAAEDKQLLVDPFIGHTLSGAQKHSGRAFIAERLRR